MSICLTTLGTLCEWIEAEFEGLGSGSVVDLQDHELDPQQQQNSVSIWVAVAGCGACVRLLAYFTLCIAKAHQNCSLDLNFLPSKAG